MLLRSFAPRSETKYTEVPCHIGWASFAGLLVMFLAAFVVKSKSQRSGDQPPRYRFQLRKSWAMGM